MAGARFGSRSSLRRKRTARSLWHEFGIPPDQSRQGSSLDSSSLCRQARETRSDGARPGKTQQWLLQPATSSHRVSISGLAHRKLSSGNCAWKPAALYILHPSEWPALPIYSYRHQERYGECPFEFRPREAWRICCLPAAAQTGKPDCVSSWYLRFRND